MHARIVYRRLGVSPRSTARNVEQCARATAGLALASPLAERAVDCRTAAASLDLPLCHANREGRCIGVRMERRLR